MSFGIDEEWWRMMSNGQSNSAVSLSHSFWIFCRSLPNGTWISRRSIHLWRRECLILPFLWMFSFKTNQFGIPWFHLSKFLIRCNFTPSSSQAKIAKYPSNVALILRIKCFGVKLSLGSLCSSVRPHLTTHWFSRIFCVMQSARKTL